MNRRAFLRTLVAVPAIVAVPLLSSPAEVPITISHIDGIDYEFRDDTPWIQAQIDKTIPGGSFTLPVGIYHLGTPLILRGNNVMIQDSEFRRVSSNPVALTLQLPADNCTVQRCWFH